VPGWSKPGAHWAVGGSDAIWLQNGGRLEAVGTADSTIIFTAQDTTQAWDGLWFIGTPGDTSYLKHVEVAWASGYVSGWSYEAAVRTRDSHPLVVDSSVIRQSLGEGVRLGSPGARFTHSVIDSAGSTGVVLGHDQATVEHTLIRGAAGRGLYVGVDSVAINYVEVTGSGAEGIYVPDPDGVTINNCNLIDNTDVGVHNNSSSVTLDATNNWWGDSGGPTGTNGDGVSALVNYTPYLTAPVTILYFRP
jgi:hypothetical protein